MASAKTLLALMKEAKRLNSPTSRWWVVLIQCWTASIVMWVSALVVSESNSQSLIDLFYTTEADEAEEKRKEVQEALLIFKDIQHASTVAKKAVLTLNRLLEEDRLRRAESGTAESASKKRRISVEGFTPVGLAPNFPGLHGDTATPKPAQSMLDSMFPMPFNGGVGVENRGNSWENTFMRELDFLNGSNLDLNWKFDEYS